MNKLILAAIATAPWVGLALAPTDPIAAVPKDGLTFEKGHGYLVSLLKSLNINPDSQVLVFSKSSLQSSFIGLKSPRALYFNQDTYVGWIPGAPVIEIMTVDPVKGPVFYTLPNEKPMDAVVFTPEGPRCFRCHGGMASVASLFVRSSHVPESGYPRAFTRSIEVTPSTPINERWGGWYVSGTHGTMRHMGNVPSTGTDENPKLDTAKGANATNLSKFVNLKKYLSPNSDIVALMVFEQQMHVQNAISQLARETQNQRYIRPDAVEYLVRALLGSGEIKLTSPIKGTSTFAQTYAKSAPTDQQGRSFSQLDLRTRIQKYPCSPLVYSESFRALANPVRAEIWKKMDQVLTAASPAEPYRHLSAQDRAAVRQILVETVPEYAALDAAH